MNHMTQHTSPSGTCTLVGAGPGDPELLTLKAVKAIGQATLLLVDDLVNPEILGHASTGARIIHVGKRGGCASTPRRSATTTTAIRHATTAATTMYDEL